mgnify:CR=1 FL=1
MAALNNNDNNDNNDNIKWGDVFNGNGIPTPYYYIELWGQDVVSFRNEMISEFGFSYPVNDTQIEMDMIEKLNEIVDDIKNKKEDNLGYYGWITEQEEEGDYTNFQVRVLLYDAEGEVDKCMWERYVSDILDPPPPPKSAGKKK